MISEKAACPLKALAGNKKTCSCPIKELNRNFNIINRLVLSSYGKNFDEDFPGLITFLMELGTSESMNMLLLVAQKAGSPAVYYCSTEA